MSRYETLRDTMREELNRFQKERAAEMAGLLRDFAVAQVGERVTPAAVARSDRSDGPHRARDSPYVGSHASRT
jgi:hypothetical protein